MSKNVLFLIIAFSSIFCYPEVANSQRTVPQNRIPFVQPQPSQQRWDYPITFTRDEKYTKWFSASVRIQLKNKKSSAINPDEPVKEDTTGSGTIIYYDPRDGYAYVQSCAHFWNGDMSAEQCLEKKLKFFIVLPYKNDEKLAKPIWYHGEVLYFVNNKHKTIFGNDCSLMRFKPEGWEPSYFPLESKVKIPVNATLYSVGCDNRTEVALYHVKYSTKVTSFQVNADNTKVEAVCYQTKENNPRPGRSGGGLFYGNKLVGLCTNTDGQYGFGYFTANEVMAKYNEKYGYGWLNDVNTLARDIPIIDRVGKELPVTEIPLPSVP